MVEVVLALVLLCTASVSHRGTASAAPEVADGAAECHVILCYWGSWSHNWDGAGKFSVENIDASLCTHLVYAFAKLDNGVIAPFDPYLDLNDNYGIGMYEKVNYLKATHPHLKTLLAIGGWNEGSVKYSQMASTPTGRQRFAQSVVAFLGKHGFDGLDLDWEYPAARGGVPQDKENFVLLLQELRSVLEPKGLLLTAAVSPASAITDAGYDVPAITEYLDYISVMAYDFFDPWDNYTGHCSPLGARENGNGEEKALNVESAMKRWLRNGADPAKLVLGMPLYGLTFTLASANSSGFWAPTTGPGPAGPVTREAGYLGYNEICSQLQTSANWNITRDPHVVAPVAVSGNVWIGYDDAKSLTAKVQFARSLGLAGTMVWSIETDDFNGACGGIKNPLQKAIRDALASTAVVTTTRATVPSSEGTTTTAGVETPGTTETLGAAAVFAPSAAEAVVSTTPAPKLGCSKGRFYPYPNDWHSFYQCLAAHTPSLSPNATPDTVFDCRLHVLMGESACTNACPAS